MLNQTQHEALEARLAQNVKWSEGLSQRIEESTGWVSDSRVHQEGTVRVVNLETDEERLANPY